MFLTFLHYLKRTISCSRTTPLSFSETPTTTKKKPTSSHIFVCFPLLPSLPVSTAEPGKGLGEGGIVAVASLTARAAAAFPHGPGPPSSLTATVAAFFPHGRGWGETRGTRGAAVGFPGGWKQSPGGGPQR